MSRDIAEILGAQQVDAEQTLLDFAMLDLEGARQSITRPNVQENSFEIKPTLLQMIQATVLVSWIAFRGPKYAHSQLFRDIGYIQV